MSAPDLGASDSVTVGAHTLRVWPKGQKIQKWFGTDVLVTKFADNKIYAPALRTAALEQANDPTYAHQFEQSLGVGSAKVYDIDKWPIAAATLVHARALAFFRYATRSDSVAVDLSWASVYHDGDHCLPHSHPRTLVSVLYVLDLGDATGDMNGAFCFADPRLAPCCREEEGYMSTPCAPIFEPGLMLLFPGKAVHFVAPYHGDKPRLTMSWNLNKVAREGAPLPESIGRPG